MTGLSNKKADRYTQPAFRFLKGIETARKTTSFSKIATDLFGS